MPNNFVTLDKIKPWSSSTVDVDVNDNSSQAWNIDHNINSKVSLWKGDITRLSIDCIVNAAKEDLTGGGGIDGVIHRAAGKKLLEACLKINGCPRCPTGESRLTRGFDLPAKFILHTVGPTDSNGHKLRDCYDNCLAEIIPNSIKSVAFCCVATGVYKFPQDQAAEIALKATRQWLEINHGSIHRIIFCVYNDVDHGIYEGLMSGTYFPNTVIDFINHNSVLQKRKHDDEDTVEITKSVGRKKKKKTIPVAKCTKKFMLFSDLDVHAGSSRKIHCEEIKSDVNEKEETGFYYHYSKNVTIKYTVGDNSDRKSIRLDNLLQRGFPSFEYPNSILQINVLNDIVRKCDQAIQITKVSSDVKNQPEENLEGPWEYQCSRNVTISYIIDNRTCSIRLNNLIVHGFTIPREFKYYSFLQFKNYCKKMGRTWEDVKDDESTFMSILHDINYYYISHSEYVHNQSIGEFCGPQSFEDRNCNTLFFYYGAGKVKFYRRKDLLGLIYNDYGQVKTNKFLNNPGNCDFITENQFDEYIHEINDNISRHKNKSKYHRLFTPFSGPQCYEDIAINPHRLQYDVNYITHSKRETTFATVKKDECDALVETLLNSRFSLRICEDCDQIRILGNRAAKKYPLCFYVHNGKHQFLRFRCENLFNMNCESDEDLRLVNFGDVQIGKSYMLYAEESNYLFGNLVHICEMVSDKNYAKFNVVQSFGSDTWINDDILKRGEWLNNLAPGRWRIGWLSDSTRRWKGNNENPVFKLSEVVIENPHEAKCAQPFHDTHLGHIDHDDASQEITFGSLVRVRNIHKLLSSLKILFCVRCKKNLPGLEDLDKVLFNEDGSAFGPEFKSIKDVYKHSEVINTTKMHLDQNFQTSAAYSWSNARVTGVCTECSEHYEVDENGSLNPVFVPFKDSQSQSQSQQSSCREGATGMNIYSPENLFTLDLFNDENYALFIKSLTVAELLVITPLHITINVLRCRATQMPFSKNSSIGFPLKSAMGTDHLPWTGFINLPFIVICYNDIEGGVPKEAKINLEHIVRAKDLMSQRMEHELFPNGRTRYRYVGEGFATFTNEQMNNLRDELIHNRDSEGYAEPTGLRKLLINEKDFRQLRTVPKEQVKNWLTSEFPYANAVHDGCVCEKSDNLVDESGNVIFESFWTVLKKFIISYMNEKSKEALGNPRKEEECLQKVNSGDQMVTYDLLIRFVISKRWVNDINNNSVNVHNEIYEEFSVLASCFTNDEGPDFVHGSVHPSTTNDPDEIYRTNIQNTALDRRRVVIDRAKKAPEWSPGYLQMAFIDPFFTGDADFHQQRPIPINQNGGASRLEYLRRLSMFKEVQEHTVLTFVINNLLRKHDAMKAATVFLKDVDVTSIDVPTREQVLSNPDDVRDMSKFVLQYGPLTRDSKQSWKVKLQNAIGTKRDLEYLDDFSRGEKNHPTLPALFRTMAYPYTSGCYFHRLFSYTEGEDVTNINHRRAKVLTESMVIEWVGSLIAELDLKYLAPYRCPTSYYIGRDEKGANGNPHWHSLLYSDELGKLIWKLKASLEEQFEEVCHKIEETSPLDSWSNEEKEILKQSMVNEWNEMRCEIVKKIDGMYTNWNPCYTSRGDLTGTYKLPDITTINPSDIIDAGLKDGDLSSLDVLYCNIVNSYCRHIVHRGKDGKPAKTDYCYKVDKVKDKTASREKGKIVRKEVIKCTRRKPQKKRVVPAIHADPHDKKIYQVSFQCNDEWFNGADPFVILLVLGNADTKALVHSMFTKKPKFTFSEEGHTAKMTLNLDPGDSACEYVIKYLGKAPVPIRTDQEIYTNVTKKMEHAITKSGVYQCYTQAAIQGCVSLLTAQHVNLRLPQVLCNTECTSINVLGRKTLKRLKSPDSESFLNENRIDEFEARFNMSPYSSANSEEVQIEMSLHQFFDKYSVSFDKQKRLIVRNRKRTKYIKNLGHDVYQSIRLTPHTTMVQANPKRETYGVFCKKMCLWQKPYLSIRDTIRTFNKEEKVQEDKYWIDEFNEEFPGGKGLETAFHCYVQHYEKKLNGNDSDDSETDETDDEENDISSHSEENENDGNQVKGKKANVTAKRDKSERFYQTTDDLLLKPLSDDLSDDNNCCVNDELNKLSTEYMANARLEDLTKWLPKGENPKVSGIEMGFTTMKEKCGDPAPVYESRPLTKKQEMVKRIIMNWVHDRLGERKMDPLRLFVLGLPGVGKTFAFKITATEMMNTLGEDWKDKVRFATPTGSVSFHMGFNAQTLHRTFYIRVGHEGEVFEGVVDKILQIKKLLPNTIIIIIFDECSMIPRQLFATICNRLEEAGIQTKDIGFVFFGDPAQISPIGGLPLWSTENAKGVANILSIKGMTDFRDLMGMTPVVDIKGYQKLKQLSKTHEEYAKYYQQVGQKLYEGKYNAVYMDEVMRTDYSKLSDDLKNIQIQGRYGNFTLDSLARLKLITANEGDIMGDPEWKHKTTLTGFHYYSEQNPERSNADSKNASALVDYSNATTNGIMRFESIHSPAGKSRQLSSLPAKDFQNISANLHLAFGARIILIMNINPSLVLFNGAEGIFIGPLYLSNSTYEINSLQVLKTAAVDRKNRTTNQVELTLPSGKNEQLPKGSVLISVNGNDTFDYKEVESLQEPFSVHIQIPQQPPFLPDYLVIEFPGYSESGGPPFFKDAALKDYVCIKPQTFTKKETRHSGHRMQETRKGFPIELSYVMTAFKGIGDNHTRTELMLHGNFSKPGLFLVGISRVVNPKHLYIHPEHWPSYLELKTQRLNDHVLQSENFERFIRIVGARDMRHYGFELLDGVPGGIDKHLFNFIADQIYYQWSNGVHEKEDICKGIFDDTTVLDIIDDNMVDKVYSFMKSSDEYLVTKKVPYLSKKERYYLENVVQNKKRGTAGASVGKMMNNASTKQKNVVNTNSSKKKVSSVNIAKTRSTNLTNVSAATTGMRKHTDEPAFSNIVDDMSMKKVSKSHVTRPEGLYNVGNTCFINASLQMLRTLPCSWSTMIASSNTLESKLCNIMNLLANNSNSEPIPQKILTNFKHEVNTVMNNNVLNEQQDAQEAMTKMFETSAWLSEYVTFQQDKNTHCLSCERVIKVTSENKFLVLHPSRRDMPLHECIHSYCAPERLQDYVCENCQSGDLIFNSTEIVTSPHAIFIQLGQLGHHGSNSVSIDSQIVINDNAYIFKSAIHYDGIMESGEAGGHYTAYTEVNGDWFKFDDSLVNRVSIDNVKSAAQNYYILCYLKT